MPSDTLRLRACVGPKSIDASPVMPNLSFSCVMMCASSALRSSAFDGMHPTLRHTPPQYFASTTAARRPSWEARIAATYPPGPAPRTTTSKSAMGGSLLTVSGTAARAPPPPPTLREPAQHVVDL